MKDPSTSSTFTADLVVKLLMAISVVKDLVMKFRDGIKPVVKVPDIAFLQGYNDCCTISGSKYSQISFCEAF